MMTISGEGVQPAEKEGAVSRRFMDSIAAVATFPWVAQRNSKPTASFSQ